MQGWLRLAPIRIREAPCMSCATWTLTCCSSSMASRGEGGAAGACPGAAPAGVAGGLGWGAEAWAGGYPLSAGGGALERLGVLSVLLLFLRAVNT